MLRQTPAAVRFLSCEPLLGPLRLFGPAGAADAVTSDAVTTDAAAADGDGTAAGHLDWVIVGGESGRGARPFNVAWARDIIAQCREAGVACFIKQLGAKSVAGESPLALLNRKGGAPAEWPDDLRVREFPAVATSDPRRLAS